jgi:phage-related baseplate assembly protein
MLTLDLPSTPYWLTLPRGVRVEIKPVTTAVMAAAQAAATAYASAQHRLGRDVTLSGLFAALHQPGVQRVVLAAPAATLTIGSAQASWCTAITLTNGGVDE